MNQPDTASVWEPIAAAAPVGLMAPAQIQSHCDELPRLSAIAAKVLDDPLQVQLLAERVYQLMQQDSRLQRERCSGYGGRR